MERKDRIMRLLDGIQRKYIWDEEPVFCITSDIDWASEAVMSSYFDYILPMRRKPTLFVTHNSPLIEERFKEGLIDRGLHPNFMDGSSHGNSFREIADTCRAFAPESYGFRSHRAFDVTDITHMMHNDYGYKYVSNQITIMQPNVKPILHESGLINYPVFFEDGTHLYNELDLSVCLFDKYITSPGVKILSFHPMNFVFNSPSYLYMRSIKDTLTREQFNNIDEHTIKRLANKSKGIRDFIFDMIDMIEKNGYKWYTMNELYDLVLGEKYART